MNRRDFLLFAASAAVATALPLPAHAQQLPRTLWIARDNPQDGVLLDISTGKGIAYLHTFCVTFVQTVRDWSIPRSSATLLGSKRGSRTGG